MILAAALVLIVVIDGDTVERAGVRYRLTGLDTPEIVAARCGEERNLGLVAAARLVQLMEQRPAELVETGARDRYGRTLARLMLGGEDWAAIAIREGLAKPYEGRGPRPDWCSP